MASTDSSSARGLDIAARSIDLLTVLTKVAQSNGISAAILREVSNWLGREGLDESELTFFLEASSALARPNDQAEVVSFFTAITNRAPKKTVVPLSVLPSGALGRLISSDLSQRWITSTISCLFRYHDERFIKYVLCSLIVQSTHKGSKPLTDYQLTWHPSTLRMTEVVNKIVHSNWLHIANAGIIGSPTACPGLPRELNWACERGHNIESSKLALILLKLMNPPRETIFQSELLLTNLVLWLIWHFDGSLRIVVSGKIIYDKRLGPSNTKIEFRVAKFCTNTIDKDCGSKDTTPSPSFSMLENVAGSFKELFRGKYDTQQTLMQQSKVRQKLYHSPFQYPKGSHSIRIQTQRTAQELLRWFIERPVMPARDSSKLEFRISLVEDKTLSAKYRVGDLLGRTPGLLNMQCGDLGRSFVVFSPPREPTPPTVEDIWDEAENEGEQMELHTEEESVDFEDKPEHLLRFFPILNDLDDSVSQSCRCYRCHRQGPLPGFHFDDHCLRYKAFMEVMLFFSHGITDAFGAPDASSCAGDVSTGDSGAMAILFDLIDDVRFDPQRSDGLLSWNTLLSTSAQVFLGCLTLSTYTDSSYNDSATDILPTHLTNPTNISSIVVAIQYGDLAVVAPWLDISQPITIRKSFQFTIAEGRLGLMGDEGSDSLSFQSLGRDVAVIETQHTEVVSDDTDQLLPHTTGSNAQLELLDDRSEPLCDYILVSVHETKYKLLMRISSNAHSRMVDPGRAILRLFQGMIKVKCKHKPIRKSIMPQAYATYSYDFDHLLGAWGAASEATESNVGNESAGESAANQHDQLKGLHISHVLHSSFKYNAAIALAGDGPVIVNREDACLTCVLEKVANNDLNGKEGKKVWVVNGVRDPVILVPSSKRLKTVRRANLLEARKRSKVDGSSTDGGMEIE